MIKRTIIFYFLALVAFFACGEKSSQQSSCASTTQSNEKCAHSKTQVCITLDSVFWQKVDSLESLSLDTSVHYSLERLASDDPLSLVKLNIGLRHMENMKNGDAIFLLSQELQQEIIENIGDQFVCSIDYKLHSEKVVDLGWKCLDAFRQKYGMHLIVDGKCLVIEPQLSTNAMLCYPYCSKSIQDYITQFVMEEKEGYIENNTLLISYKQLGERIIHWEDYMQKYPHNLLKKEITNKIEEYTSILLCGTPASGLYDNAQHRLLPVIQQYYENHMENFPDHSSSQKIKSHYEKLKRNDFKKIS